MNSVHARLLLVSCLTLGALPIYSQSASDRFWSSNHLVAIPLAKQADAKPGEMIVVQGGTPLWYPPVEAVQAETATINIPYIKNDKSMEIGILARLFGYAPAFTFKNSDSFQLNRLN